jgi:uncharacterized membrane protein YkvA (DUF1232 family)
VTVVERWRVKARAIKRDVYALYLACRDPRTPWYAKAMATAVVAYALSPIDIVPDFVPVLGYLDDLLLLPIGILLSIRMVPPAVMADCREQAAVQLAGPTSRTTAAVIIAIWVVLAAFGLYLLLKWLKVI